mgnify:FL=1
MENKLNIGLFIDTFYPMIDGVINVVDNYARRLNKIANVTVFAPKSRYDNFDDSTLPYKVVRCKRFNLKFLKLDYDLPLPSLDKNFKKAIKDANLDIIHIHSPFSIGKMAASYGNKHNIPVVATMHSQFKKDFYKSTKSKVLTNIMLDIIAHTFNKCDVLWTMNPGCAKLSKEYGYKGQIDIVPNATDLVNEFAQDEIASFKKEISAKYDIKEDEKIFINIGRLNKLKNLTFVINVCKLLSEKNFKFKLLLIGDGSDKKYFENKVKNENLQDKIIFVGRVSSVEEKSKLFAISDLQIFPSYYDTDGIVRIEAAAFYVPTIFIENSLASSTITNDVNGYIGKNNKEKFAQKIIDIFSDEELYNKVKIKCHEDLYINWDSLMTDVLKKYKNLIEEKKCKKI